MRSLLRRHSLMRDARPVNTGSVTWGPKRSVTDCILSIETANKAADRGRPSLRRLQASIALMRSTRPFSGSSTHAAASSFDMLISSDRGSNSMHHLYDRQQSSDNGLKLCALIRVCWINAPGRIAWSGTAQGSYNLGENR